MPRKIKPFGTLVLGQEQSFPAVEIIRQRRAFMRGLRNGGICLKCAKVLYIAACHNVVATNWRGTGFKLDKDCSEAFLIFLHETPVDKNRYVDAVRVMRPRNDQARMIAEKVYNKI
jgi:hypothetical protein